MSKSYNVAEYDTSVGNYRRIGPNVKRNNSGVNSNKKVFSEKLASVLFGNAQIGDLWITF